MKKIDLNTFINNFKLKFPNKHYLFDKSIYNGNKKKMIVICPKHGEFNIRPNDLLNGCGCPYCGGTHKLTNEEFIYKANLVHNNFFSYSKTKYLNSNTKLIVTCPIHGDFEVKANNHLRGINCYKCNKENIKHEITKIPQQTSKSTKKLDNTIFIEKATNLYGDKYSYEKCFYINSRTKVIINCYIHGSFEVTPNHFLKGRGCPKCAKNKKKTTEEFIQELKDKKLLIDCDFAKIEYKSAHEPVCVICSKHGEFWNTPSNILKQQGCPKCNQSKLELEVYKLLTDNNIEFVYQKKFDWLGRQSLDFYLPEYNIVIECQGIQHFKPVDFFGGEKEFKKRQTLDEQKLTLCNKHNIKIIYYYSTKLKYNNKIYFNECKEMLKYIKNLAI